MSIKNIIDAIVNILLDGSFERVRIISQMNAAFKEYFTTGDLNRLCKVSITKGRQEFAHEMSALWFRSGFKISIENDINITDGEMTELSTYITENLSFVRQLMALGFDTLVIQGKITGKRHEYALKKYANLNQYYID